MKKKADKIIEGLMLVLGLAIALGLFMMLPAWLGKVIGNLLGGNEVAVNIIEGILRLAIFIGYVYFVSFIPDIKRVFMYHGAEHKTVNAYEGGSDLSLEDVLRYPTFHPRCGTSFLFFLIIVTIILFTILHTYFPVLNNGWLRVTSRVILLPVIAGLAYECIRITGKYPNSRFSQTVIWPGQIFQRITSLEPTPDMVEVAIYAFKGAMGEALPEGVSSKEPDAVKA